MKTLVVGDIHGCVEVVEKALSTKYPVIFTGDYLDSFNRSVKDQITSLQLVLDAIDATKNDFESNKIYGLLGNHEMSYLSRSCRCSGYNSVTAAHVMSMDLKPLLDYIYCEGFLISHAGVSQSLLDYNKITLDQYLESKNFDTVGWIRGGYDHVGGLRWCDWFYEFEPIKSQPQIVGHSHIEYYDYNLANIIQQKGNSYCIDTRYDINKEVLLIENGIAEIVKLNEL